MRAFWLRKLLKWRYVDEFNPSDFWSVRNFDCNYIQKPGHIDGLVLKPHAIQRARRLRTALRRRGVTAIVYVAQGGVTSNTSAPCTDQFFIKSMGNRMQVRSWAVVGMPFYKRWIYWMVGTDSLATGFRERNGYILIQPAQIDELSKALD